MAELNKSNFESRYNHVTTGLYIDNTTQAISEADLRDLVTYIKDSVLFRKDDRYTLFQQFTTATSTTAYTGTPSPTISAYATGQVFQVKAHATSTGSATLNLNVLGAKKWYTSPTTQVGTGDVVIDTIYLVAYDATLDSGTGGFLIVGGGGGGGGTPGGSDTQIQFNDGGAFGGDAGAVFNKTTNVATFGGVNVSGLTASLPVRTDASKNLESRTVLQFLSDLGIDLTHVACSVSSGTMTLDLDSKLQRCFYNSTTVSSAFTIAFSNTTDNRIVTLDQAITGTVAITMPSSTVMETSDTRWDNGTKILTLVGTTDSPFEFSWTKSGSVWKLKVSDRYNAS